MRLRDIRISRQIQVGLGIILAFVILIGAVTVIQINHLWQDTKGLYDHPLTVRRAIGKLRSDVLAIHWGMRELFLVEDTQTREKIIQTIKTYELDAYQQFDTLYERYLGPRQDIDNAYMAFIQGSDIHAETIRLLRSGNIEEAGKVSPPLYLGSKHVDELLDSIQVIDTFSSNKADEFYRQAQGHLGQTYLQYGIMVGLILVLTALIRWHLIRTIRRPLADLTSATEEFQQGNYHARSQYTAGNEFGVLAASFNHLAETIQTELSIRQKASQIAGDILSEDDLRGYCQILLKTLLSATNAQMGAVYFLNQEKTSFERCASIGLDSGSRASFSAKDYEGEFGAVLATRQIQRLREIPTDTKMVFSAIAGDLIPKEIITIPLLKEDEVAAVISLASLYGFSSEDVRLIEDIWELLTARTSGVLSAEQVRSLAVKLEAQNRELAEQAKELLAQANELSEQNIELEMQKQQLGEASRMKSAFLSNMSHELRTPLNSVIALSSVLSRRLRGGIPQEEYGYLEVIERNGRHLLEMINDILDISRIEAGRVTLDFRSFNIGDTITDVVNMVEPLALEKGIAIHTAVNDDLPPLISDPVKCRHILQNLASNAVKFTDAGKVEITARLVEDRLHISVSDTGIGIPADKLKVIFDEFRQADESASKRYGGSGLGLAIAKKYAEMLGGDILVESTPGKGSTFTLILPLKIAESGKDTPNQPIEITPPAGKTAPPPANASASTKTILVVEDSPPAVVQISDILTENGFEVKVARNGRQALEILQSALPDAVILDLMMPDVDGFEVLRLIREVSRTAGLPVLILTAKQVTEEELAFLKGNNVHQLIQKGDINKKDLLTAVNKMVSGAAHDFAPDQPPSSSAPLPNNLTVLIIDDNADNRETFKVMLEDCCTILEAEDGMSGIEQAQQRQPDLILLDISMPGMDGYKTLDAIRRNDSIRHIPVIALTARAMKGDRENILAHGFDGYISKPVDIETLQNTIGEVWRKWSQTKGD